jgi:hypothetical protein
MGSLFAPRASDQNVSGFFVVAWQIKFRLVDRRCQQGSNPALHRVRFAPAAFALLDSASSEK